MFRGFTLGAHTMAFRWTKGPVPRGKFVLHKCDHPECVRPYHLFIGTQAINMADKARKGRAASGERHGMAKLRLAQVAKMFELRKKGLTQREIGERFGVCQAHVSDILSGQVSWRNALKRRAA